MKSPTYGVFVFLRAFLVEGKTDAGVKLMEQSRIYPLAQKDTPPAMKFPNASGVPADYDFKRDIRYFNRWRRSSTTRSGRARRQAMRGMAASLGIVKGKPFQPDAKLKAMLNTAADVAFKMAAVDSYDTRYPKDKLIYPDRKCWEVPFQAGNAVLRQDSYLDLDANDVHLAYIYIRGEMPDGAKLLNQALNEARAKNFLGKNILGSGYDLEIYVHRGAGAYICGEETGLIESLEGKRPYPRIKPPYFPAVLGLWMCPTIVNNVETLCNVKHIVAMGGAEFAKLGTPNNTGTRIVSLSGHVKRPGYYEIEIGKVTIGELINDPAFGGGLRDGRKLKAVIPGGSSAKVFKAGEKFKLKKKDAGRPGSLSRKWTCWICLTISIRSSPPAR